MGTATVFNIAKGSVAALAGFPASPDDGLVAVLLKTSGLESAATLQDYDTLAAILGAANDEADFTSYARQALTGVTATVDDSNNRVDVDADNIEFTVGSGQAIGAIVICYVPDTGTPVDADTIPLIVDDSVAGTPPVGTLTYQVASGGFFRAS